MFFKLLYEPDTRVQVPHSLNEVVRNSSLLLKNNYDEE